MRSPIPVFSVAKYLEAESKSELRHEYLAGQIFAMAGGSKAHNIITLNIASRFLIAGWGLQCVYVGYESQVKRC
ncbi:hypothetical protein [Nostoc sp. UHCC 0926]|uniref:hypothetical protein n=1 Tax=Nostoc sp. UHCC 0926 TaxID=3025190 RepID=UPI003FD14673